MTGYAPRPPQERFWEKVDRSGDCWLWTGCVDSQGYGKFARGGKYGGAISAHQFAYELVMGPLPAGQELDHRHTCPKNCVRLGHLRLVPHKQNMENLAGAYVNSRSGVRGVFWDKQRNKWKVKVGHYGKQYYGGYWDTLIQAEAAAIALRNQLFTHNDADRTEYVGA